MDGRREGAVRGLVVLGEGCWAIFGVGRSARSAIGQDVVVTRSAISKQLVLTEAVDEGLNNPPFPRLYRSMELPCGDDTSI